MSNEIIENSEQILSKEENEKIENYIKKIFNGKMKVEEFNNINEAKKEWIYCHLSKDSTEIEIKEELKQIFGTELIVNVKNDTKDADGYYIPEYNSNSHKYEFLPYGDTIIVDYAIDSIKKENNQYIISVVKYSVQRDLERNADIDYSVYSYNPISDEYWKNWKKVFEKTNETDEMIKQKVLNQKSDFLSYNLIIEKNDIGNYNIIKFEKINKS